MATDLVPVLDLDRDPALVGRELDDVCHAVGFFQIVGHGMPGDLADAAWEAARAFFDLPLEDRLVAARPHPQDAYGYVPIEAEALSRSMIDGALPADLKETFNVGPVDSLDRAPVDAGEAWAFGANHWPTALPELRATWEPYYREMLSLSARLLSSLAVGLSLPADWFESMIDESTSALRAVNYPDQSCAPVAGQLRAGAHTDYGTLTILRQDDAPGGLEVLDANGRWVPVRFVPDALVVNIGDLLARWTNDRWRSTLHRVVNPPPDAAGSTRRQSMPFFHNANYHCVVETLPTCRSADGTSAYEPVVAGPHLMAKYHRSVQAT